MYTIMLSMESDLAAGSRTDGRTFGMYYPPPGLIVPLSAGKRGTIIQGGGWYRDSLTGSGPILSLFLSCMA
jgi:hypothetical protein